MNKRLFVMRPKLFIAAAGLSLLIAIPVSLALNTRDVTIKSQQHDNHVLQLKIEKLQQTRAKKLNDIKLAAAVQKITPPAVPAPVVAPQPAPVAPACETHECWMSEAGIAQSDFAAVDRIVSLESSWNIYAVEPTTGACGLLQELPCGKSGCARSDPVCILRWGTGYVTSRYGGWWGALNFHLAHGWY